MDSATDRGIKPHQQYSPRPYVHGAIPPELNRLFPTFTSATLGGALKLFILMVGEGFEKRSSIYRSRDRRERG
jgi:hypothetical protein